MDIVPGGDGGATADAATILKRISLDVGIQRNLSQWHEGIPDVAVTCNIKPVQVRATALLEIRCHALDPSRACPWPSLDVAPSFTTCTWIVTISRWLVLYYEAVYTLQTCAHLPATRCKLHL